MIARIPDQQYSTSPMRKPLSGLLYPLPPTYMSTRCHLCDRCSQVFLVFHRSSASSMYYTECKPMNKNGGGLGTRLVASMLFTWEALTAYDKCFGQNDKTLHAGVGKC